MGKKKDTRSFIERARLLHGDLYDYSETVYTGNREKITFRCNGCGAINTAAACVHLRKDKPSGCRKCGIERSLQRRGKAKKCIACGERLKYSRVRNYCEGCKPWWTWTRRSLGVILVEHNRWLIKHGTPWDHWATSKHCIITNRKLAIKRGYMVRTLRMDWVAWCDNAKSKLRSEETTWQRKARNWARSLNERERMQAAKNCSR